MSETSPPPPKVEPTTSPPATPPTESERIAALRADLAAERVSKRGVEEQLAASKAEAEKAKVDAENRIKAAVEPITGKLTKMQQRVIVAELKAEAAKAGLADPDLLLHPLLDRSKIVLDEDGGITGVSEAFEALKAKKPEWFKKAETKTGITPVTTGSGVTPTPATGGAGGTINVKTMTPQEYTVFKEAALRKLRAAH